MNKMKSEGIIQDIDAMKQLPIFENLRYVVPDKVNECGIQSPTDVDLLFEFQKQILIIVEFKKEGNEVPNGQNRTFTSNIDMTRYPYAFYLVATHNSPDNVDYDASTTLVQKIYYKLTANSDKGEWKYYDKPVVLRDMFDKLFEVSDIDFQHYNDYRNAVRNHQKEMLNNL